MKGKKAFLAKPRHKIMYPNKEEKMEIIKGAQVYPIWQMNFGSMENGGENSFSWQTKASISCILNKRMCLQWPIRKRTMIIMGIRVLPI